MQKHNLVSISTPTGNQLLPTQIQLYKEVLQHINNNNNYVNLQHVTNLGLYNKLMFVTQKQVLELYITAIECKTLYSLHIPHTGFPNATETTTEETTNATTNEVHVTKDRGIEPSHNLVEKCHTTGFYPTIKES